MSQTGCVCDAVSPKSRPPCDSFALLPHPTICPVARPRSSRCHGLEGRRRGNAGPLNRQRPFIYHRSKLLRTCVDRAGAGAAPLPVCHHTETARRWVASALSPCGGRSGKSTEGMTAIGNIRTPPCGPFREQQNSTRSMRRTTDGVRALRGTYPARIGFSYTLLILSIVATQLQAGTGHRGFRVSPDRLG